MWDRFKMRNFGGSFRLISAFFSIIINICVEIINGIKMLVARSRIKKENFNRRSISNTNTYNPRQFVERYSNNKCIVMIAQSRLRSSLLTEYIIANNETGIPVICFTSYGTEIQETLLKRSNPGKSFFVNSDGFEPFVGLPEEEICNIVVRSTYRSQNLKLSQKSIYYIKGILEFLKCKRVQFLFNNIYRCVMPSLTTNYCTLIEWVENEKKQNCISSDDWERIAKFLYAGQGELDKLQEVFSILQSDLAPYCKGSKRLSVQTALERKQIIVFDIGMMNAEITVSLLSTILSFYRRVRPSERFILVVDSYQYVLSNELKEYIHSHLLDESIVLASENVNQMIEGQEKEWKTIAGGSTTLLVGKQSGSDMAKLISDYFGTYEKIVQNWGTGNGTSVSPVSIISGASHRNNYESYQESTKPKVSIDDLQHLESNEVLVSCGYETIIDRIRIVD